RRRREAIKRGRVRRQLAESGDHTQLCGRVVVDAGASANHCLFRHTPGDTSARSNIGPVSVILPARLAAHAWEKIAADERRGRSRIWKLGRWVFGIVVSLSLGPIG